jgi:hypothetical protein
LGDDGPMEEGAEEEGDKDEGAVETLSSMSEDEEDWGGVGADIWEAFYSMVVDAGKKSDSK